MHILIVNPNTSEGVTQRIQAAAEAVARPDDVFLTRSAAFGPSLIVTPEDADVAVEGVRATVRAATERIDGIVLASFGDTGAEEVRMERPHLPVMGIGSAAFSAARALGGRVGVVTFGPTLVPALCQMAEANGLTRDLLRIEAVPEGEQGDPGTVQARLADALLERCHAAAAGGVRSIILGGGPLAGLARVLGPQIPVPIIDGTQAAIGLMRAVADPARPR